MSDREWLLDAMQMANDRKDVAAWRFFKKLYVLKPRAGIPETRDAECVTGYHGLPCGFVRREGNNE